MTPLEWTTSAAFVCATAGFYVGILWSSRHLPEILARASAEQLRELARRTAVHRRPRVDGDAPRANIVSTRTPSGGVSPPGTSS